MLVIVFSATGHVDCAFVFAECKMRSDATIAARSVVDIVDKVRNEVETPLECDAPKSGCRCLSGGHTCDRRHCRRQVCCHDVFLVVSKGLQVLCTRKFSGGGYFCRY
jgi:hypothetical protein